MPSPPQIDLHAWLSLASPQLEWCWPHLLHLQGLLQRVATGELRRLMIFTPPRHGKSELVTIRFPVYRLCADPGTRVILAAYNQALASRFSRRARRIAHEQGLIGPRAPADDWETESLGGVRAVGVGGGITGQGADLIVIDDPVKSREEANSGTYRERLWEWFTDDLYTRLEPRGALVLVQTRWHEDDLAGRILAGPDGPSWTICRLPAEAETQRERDAYAALIGRSLGEPEPLGRLPGEPLCPDRFDREALRRIRRVLGSSYDALYQQWPVPRTAGFFRPEWLTITPLPLAAPEPTRWIRYWDLAGTERGGDFTAGVLMGRTAGGEFRVEDVVRGQWSYGARDRRIVQVAREDRGRWGEAVGTWIEQEPGSGGREAAERLVRALAGFNAHSETVTGSKEVRAAPLASQAEIGSVRLTRGEWNPDFIDELCAFPHGRHDDQVDAAAGAFRRLTAGRRLRLWDIESP